MGITVGNQTIPCTLSSDPQCYGNVELTGEEKGALCPPSKFAVYDQVSLTSCEVNIEKGFAKLRWSITRQAESEPDGEKKEEERGRERVWPVHLDTKTVNFQYLRPTDLPFNKRVCLPDESESEKEVDKQHLKGRLLKATKKYIADRSVGSIESNLLTEERQGLRSSRANKNIVVYQTDKSGRFALDTLDNYRFACKPHVENDLTVTEELHERAQAEANAHSVLVSENLNAGESAGGQAKIKSNMLVSDCTLAPLYALRKDHKNTDDPSMVPLVRPVCVAVSAYNRKLSHLMSFILAEVWKKRRAFVLILRKC